LRRSKRGSQAGSPPDARHFAVRSRRTWSPTASDSPEATWGTQATWQDQPSRLTCMRALLVRLAASPASRRSATWRRGSVLAALWSTGRPPDLLVRCCSVRGKLRWCLDLIAGHLRAWRNGRRYGLKLRWGNSCGFDSRRPHQADSHSFTPGPLSHNAARNRMSHHRTMGGECDHKSLLVEQRSPSLDEHA
jgi:hypothetical protein